MKHCYLCDKEINDSNKSKEHIIINAIGGKLKSAELICKSCNSDLGENIDAQLAKELLFFSNYFNVKRDRGKVPNVKKIKSDKGKEYGMVGGRKFILSKPSIDIKEEENSISIEARDKKELKKILKGLKKKYPDINLKDMNHQKSYLKDPIKISFQVGNNDSLKSICKTALNFYFFKEQEKKYVKEIIDCL